MAIFNEEYIRNSKNKTTIDNGIIKFAIYCKECISSFPSIYKNTVFVDVSKLDQKINKKIHIFSIKPSKDKFSNKEESDIDEIMIKLYKYITFNHLKIQIYQIDKDDEFSVSVLAK